jgi:hypothetical protein
MVRIRTAIHICLAFCAAAQLNAGNGIGTAAVAGHSEGDQPGERGDRCEHLAAIVVELAAGDELRRVPRYDGATPTSRNAPGCRDVHAVPRRWTNGTTYYWKVGRLQQGWIHERFRVVVYHDRLRQLLLPVEPCGRYRLTAICRRRSMARSQAIRSCCRPGATFTGNFILPAKADATSYITIRSAGDPSALPPPGVRIDPWYAPQLAKLRSPNSLPALATDAYAHHYRIELLELQGSPLGYYDILTLGDGSSSQNTLAMVPHHLIVDRVYVHGNATIGQKRGIALNSASTTIENSYISDIKSEDQDAQAICGWNGPGPYTIINNYLEASGENVMFGGEDPAIVDLVPSDIVFARNYLSKPLDWQWQPWIVKNLFELKNARRVTIDGNIMENNWVSSQSGLRHPADAA